MEESELCFGEIAYDERLVVFFDILGWRSHIVEAGEDPAKIARLAAAVRLFTTHVGSIGDKDARITTFSDNVVFSKRYASDDVPWFLHGVATIMLGAATLGFLLRGGVTRGKLKHDEHIVFGPALNRAYEIESREALYPRVTIDPILHPDVPENTDYIARDDGVFIDPFRPQFFDRVQQEHPVAPEVLDAFSKLTGASLPTASVRLPGQVALAAISERLRREMMVVSQLHEWKKLAWLFDRIVSRLGGHVTSEMIPKSAALSAALGVADPD